MYKVAKSTNKYTTYINLTDNTFVELRFNKNKRELPHGKVIIRNITFSETITGRFKNGLMSGIWKVAKMGDTLQSGYYHNGFRRGNFKLEKRAYNFSKYDYRYAEEHVLSKCFINDDRLSPIEVYSHLLHDGSITKEGFMGVLSTYAAVTHLGKFKLDNATRLYAQLKKWS